MSDASAQLTVRSGLHGGAIAEDRQHEAAEVWLQGMVVGVRWDKARVAVSEPSMDAEYDALTETGNRQGEDCALRPRGG
jgi:hypothetical protein